MLMEGIEEHQSNEALLLRWCNDGTDLFMASHITRYIRAMEKQDAYHAGKDTAVLRNAKDCACVITLQRRRCLIALSYWTQLNYMPCRLVSFRGNNYSTTDNYLGYSFGVTTYF